MNLEHQHVKDDAWIKRISKNIPKSKWKHMILIGTYWIDGWELSKDAQE